MPMCIQIVLNSLIFVLYIVRDCIGCIFSQTKFGNFQIRQFSNSTLLKTYLSVFVVIFYTDLTVARASSS